MEITDNNITFLKENEIFVFGSNEAGRHGKGAAKTALKFGAKYGCSFGLYGKTFAIPTVNSKISNKLPINKIKYYVDKFYNIVIERKDLKFLITEIGCGLAGHSIKDIAPLFSKFYYLNNISLPKKFVNIIKKIEI